MTELVEQDIYCPNCGYNLRGTEAERCPECGLAVDRVALARSVVPWVHRAGIGTLAALYKTILLVSRHPRRAAADVARVADYREAQKFRWLIALIAALPWCIASIVCRACVDEAGVAQMLQAPVGQFNQPLPAMLDLAICAAVGAHLWPVPSLAILLFFAALTGLASYFFRPPGLSIPQQNRAVAMSFYTCAPLAVMFIPCALLCAALLMAYWEHTVHRTEFQIFVLLMISGAGGLIGVLFFHWFSALHLLKAATHCSNTRVTVAAILLPVLCLCLAFLCLVVFPVLCGYVALFYYSHVL